MEPLIIYIMGVSGSGKTTIGKKLSARTAIPFFDADDFHPLNDEYRAEWIMKINKLPKSHIKKNGAIIACSALKEKYRTVLSNGITIPVFWVFLHGSYGLIEKRMKARTDHFMPPTMLSSQFDALEIPLHSIAIDISQSPDKKIETIIFCICNFINCLLP